MTWTLPEAMTALLGPEGWDHDMPSTDDLYRALDHVQVRREVNTELGALVIAELLKRGEGHREMARRSRIPRTSLIRWGDKAPRLEDGEDEG